MNTDVKNIKTLDERMAAIEERLGAFEIQLADMREIFTNGFECLSKSDDGQRELIKALEDRVVNDFRRVGGALIDNEDFNLHITAQIKMIYEAVFPGRLAQMRDEINRAFYNRKS